MSLRLADEVGQDVLDWVSADVGAAAQLDQHVTAVRAELAAACQSGSASPHGPAVAAQLAGQAAVTTGKSAWRAVVPALASISCPDVPFAENAEQGLQADSVPPLRLLLHYACGLVEAAVRADWWPGESDDADGFDWESVRLAAVCRLIRQAELAAAAHPELR